MLMKIYNKNVYWQKLLDNENSKNRTNSPDKELVDTYHFIFNCLTNSIEYVSDTFEYVTGRKKSGFSISTFLDMIHPEDVEHCFVCEERGQQFTNTLSYAEHFRYLIGYSYRIRMQDGQYIAIRQQRQTMDINTQGHLTKTFIMHQKLSDEQAPLNKEYYIFDKVKNEFLDIENSFNLTKREHDVFDLIRDGLSSTQIAEKLHVSRHTVDTHRKNILKRTKSKNFFELQMRFSTLNDPNANLQF